MPRKPFASMILIAALSPSNGLGLNGGLPWSLKKEMAYFRRATTFVPEEQQRSGARNAVIMGRNTWESIPPKYRPLKGRINVVVSRTVGSARETELGIDAAEDSFLVSSLDEAVSKLSSATVPVSRTFLIGGSQLYSQALLTLDSQTKPTYIDRLLITRILSPKFKCDVHLPEFRTTRQISVDASLLPSTSADAGASQSSVTAPPNQQPLDSQRWRKQDADSLGRFLGPEGIEEVMVHEGDVLYEFQMWTLSKK